jgi:hypothetical protein
LVEISNVIAADAQTLSRLAREEPCCTEKKNKKKNITAINSQALGNHPSGRN